MKSQRRADLPPERRVGYAQTADEAPRPAAVGEYQREVRDHERCEGERTRLALLAAELEREHEHSEHDQQPAHALQQAQHQYLTAERRRRGRSRRTLPRPRVLARGLKHEGTGGLEE